jgi:hypothetical protein
LNKIGSLPPKTKGFRAIWLKISLDLIQLAIVKFQLILKNPTKNSSVEKIQLEIIKKIDYKYFLITFNLARFTGDYMIFTIKLTQPIDYVYYHRYKMKFGTLFWDCLINMMIIMMIAFIIT